MSYAHEYRRPPRGSKKNDLPPKIFSDQAHRLDHLADWYKRTYAVNDSSAIAVAARKTGNPEKPWEQSYNTLEELLASAAAGQLIIPSVFEDDLTDCYAGLTLYYKRWRCASTVRHLPLCFADLDAYKCGFTAEEAFPQVLEICRDRGLPLPTEVAFTGRGLLARWQLVDSQTGEPVRAYPQNLALWNEVQRELVQAFERLGADHGARSCAQVSRPDGTTNSKSGKMVRTVRCSNESYALGDLALALGVLFRPRTKHQARRNRVKTSVGILVPKHPKRFTLAILGLSRIQDLTELVNIRGTISEGHRQNFIMFYVSSALLAGFPVETISNQAHLFGEGFTPRFTPAEVEAAVNEAMAPRQDGRPYKWKSSSMAARLNITAEEQAYMASLTNEVERERRRVLRQRESLTAKRVLRAFEGHPGARQIDLASLTAFAQSTISKTLSVLGLRTTPHKDGRGRHFKRGI